MHQRKAILFLVSFLLFSAAFAQKETSKNLPKFDHRNFHFGFLLGVNSANFVLNRFPPTFAGADTLTVLEPKSASGFNIGIISSLHISDHFSLRFTPNLAFALRTLEYRFQTSEGPKSFSKDIESSLINLPITIKYKSARVNNFSAYILAGTSFSIDLASNAGAENNSQNLNDIIVKVKRDDIMGEVGFGTDFYLQYFKFGIELKMSYGIFDLLDDDNTPFSTPIEKLSSKMFLLSFTFEG